MNESDVLTAVSNNLKDETYKYKRKNTTEQFLKQNGTFLKRIKKRV
jgi:hypothetical protein